MNLFKAHLNALNGKFDTPKPKRFAGKAVIFAGRDILIKHSPVGNPFFADIPVKGDRYRKDDPLVSVLSSGTSQKEVLKKLKERKRMYEVIACS